MLIEQGKADTTVFPFLTDQLAAEYETTGVNVTYKTYDGVNHGGAVTDKAPATDAKKCRELVKKSRRRRILAGARLCRARYDRAFASDRRRAAP